MEGGHDAPADAGGIRTTWARDASVQDSEYIDATVMCNMRGAWVRISAGTRRISGVISAQGPFAARLAGVDDAIYELVR